MTDCEWMLEIVHRAVLDWRLLIEAQAWKCHALMPVRGGNEKVPNARCNFGELRQFFRSNWCNLCLEMNRSQMDGKTILNQLEAELAAAVEKDKKREARKRGQRTM